MLKIFKTFEADTKEIEFMEEGSWVQLVNPTEEEIDRVVNRYSVERDHIVAALDEEETARIDVEEDSTLVIVDVPVPWDELSGRVYGTIPMGIVLAKEGIITVCTREVLLLNDFITAKVKEFYTFKKTRFILQVLYKNAKYFLIYLRHIDKASERMETELHKSMKNKELIQLLALEKSLVYFTTSLRSNEIVLEKLLRMESIKKYQEDRELLEDVIIENKQAIEMAGIYSNILTSTMNAFASIISNNLNIVMKILTSITIVMTIPTMIASLFGMNVPVPLEGNSMAFFIIIGISIGASIILAIIMAKKKLF